MSAGDHLIDAARRLLGERPLGEAELIRSLYGVTGPVTPWVPLLQGLLSGAEDFKRSPDGTWTLEAEPSGPPLALAGRAGRARGGRLLALALAPADTLTPVHRWIFRQEGRTARYLNASAGLDDGSLAEAVPFAEVAEEVAALLHGRQIVTLDTQLPMALAQEFRLLSMESRAGEVTVVNQGLWAHGPGKRWLSDVRAALGLIPHYRDELVAELEVIGRLHTGGCDEGHTLWHPRMAAGTRRRLRSQVCDFPETPGVYVFRDSDGAALYVGSAVSLRRRVLSYFGDQIDVTRGLRGLLDRAATIEILPMGTHLEAVLEEAASIRELEPLYNVQRAVSSKAVWLRVGAEAPVNVVQVATAPRTDGALYIGPLSNHSSVVAVAAVLSALWGFRRRGGKAETDPAAVRRLEELDALLAEPERFATEVRVRFARTLGSLTPRQGAVLREQVERAERTALAGELRPVNNGHHSAVVARWEEVTDCMYLLLVRDLQPVACARYRGASTEALSACISGLVSSEHVGGAPDPATATLTARWLHAHRNDPFVQPLALRAAEMTTRLLDAVQATRVRLEADDVESSWWEEM